MYHFFVTEDQIGEETVVIRGSDVNHIRNVLRMRQGEPLFISGGEGTGYECEICHIGTDQVMARILSRSDRTGELPARLHLFQGLPKGDKMELVIQKAVELGVSEVVPVITRRTIVKLDKKKEEAKTARWNAVAESAAKQSGRGVIPVVRGVLSFKEALAYAGPFPVKIVAYERAEGMKTLREQLGRIRPGMDAGIFIGPEGGFEEDEISGAESAGAVPVSLGRRILRTETAGLMVLSVAGYLLETM